MTNDVSKQTVDWDNSKYFEQRIAELEFRNRELTDELTALKAKVSERKQSVWLPEKNQEYCFVTGTGYPERQIYRGILYDISLQKKTTTCSNMITLHSNVSLGITITYLRFKTS